MKLVVCVTIFLWLGSIVTAVADDDVTSDDERNNRARRHFQLIDRDVVIFAGGTNLVRAQKAGYLESLLTKHFAKTRPVFRDMAWEGDTVFQQGTVVERWRRETFGNWGQQLKRVGATLIIAQFGQTESLDGPTGLREFVAAYDRLLDELARQTDRIVLVSPTPFEKSDPLLPDLSPRNGDLLLYVDAIGEIASRRGYRFVDAFRTVRSGQTRPLTSNGMHVASNRQQDVARAIAQQLGVVNRSWAGLEPLRQAVRRKHRLWFDYWRPANWKCLYGDDGERRFGRPSGDNLSLRDEWKKFPSLIEQAEGEVWRLVEIQ